MWEQSEVFPEWPPGWSLGVEGKLLRWETHPSNQSSREGRQGPPAEGRHVQQAPTSDGEGTYQALGSPCGSCPLSVHRLYHLSPAGPRASVKPEPVSRVIPGS